MLELFIGGFAAVLTVKVLALILLGTVVGIIFGSIPGLTATMAVALCIPLTFGMDTYRQFPCLSGCKSENIRGVALAILINIPNAFFVATCFDGRRWQKEARRASIGNRHRVFRFLAEFLVRSLDVLARRWPVLP